MLSVPPYSSDLSPIDMAYFKLKPTYTGATHEDSTCSCHLSHKPTKSPHQKSAETFFKPPYMVQCSWAAF